MRMTFVPSDTILGPFIDSGNIKRMERFAKPVRMSAAASA
jgi:hypothetical protein